MAQQGGLLDGLNVNEYRWENLLVPMWWVSSEGALLLAVGSIVFFVVYNLLCPTRAGECNFNVHDAPPSSNSRRDNNIILAAARQESQQDDPTFMQLPRSYEKVRERPVVRMPAAQKTVTIKTSVCNLNVRIVGDPSTAKRSLLTVHDAGSSNLVVVVATRSYSNLIWFRGMWQESGQLRLSIRSAV